MKELDLVKDKTLTAMDVQAQVNLIQEIMKQVMTEDEHFGKIPGCPKPTLFKPGAEKIAMTFRFAAEYDELPGSTESNDFICYKINCNLVHFPTGRKVGSGRGTCNSKEKKYRTRSVFANKATEEEKDLGQEVERTSSKGKYTVYIVPQDPWDIQNTLYKMACKRALVAAVLTATAASDCFTQDIEDLPEGTVAEEEPKGKPEVKEPGVKKPTRKQMLEAFEIEKGRVGKEVYEVFLHDAGLEKTEDIKSIEDGKKLITELRKKESLKTDE